MKLLLSSYTYNSFPLREIFILAGELGVNGIELVIMPSHILAGPKKIKRLSDRYGLPIVNVHQPMWHWPHTTKGMLRRLVSFTRKVGASSAVVHLELLRAHNPPKIFSFIKSLEKEHGINIALENSPPKFINAAWAQNADILSKLAKEYNLNLTLDAPKVVISDFSPLSFFKKNAPRIKNIHIHGSSGKDYHLPISSSKYDYQPFLKELKGCDETLTLEVFPYRMVEDMAMFQRGRREKIKEVIKKDIGLIKDILII